MKNSNKIKVVVVDDEKNARDNIYNILKAHFENLDIETAFNVKSGIETINRITPQIVFLDVDMPDGTGFDLLNNLINYNFKVIFVTAHQEHALKAIKFSALDYILKPISSIELKDAVNRALNEIESENNQIKIKTFLTNYTDEDNKPKKLVLNTSNNIYIINISDIIRCESDNNYTTFFLKGNKKIIMSKTLKEYENLLPESDFIRVHRSHLININYLERFDKKKSAEVIMKDKSKVSVSIRKKDQLLEMIKKL